MKIRFWKKMLMKMKNQLRKLPRIQFKSIRMKKSKQEDIPDYKTEYNNYLAEDSIPNRPISEMYDFRKDLKEQICLYFQNEREVMIAEYLIDSLNDEGMLEQDCTALADDISFN